MSHLSAGQARRVDRAARAAHRFHRFAHHPLCPAYAGEVVALGRWRLCRGCLMAAAGALSGALLGLWIRPPAGFQALAFLVFAGAGFLGLASGRRLPKSLTRGLPAACGGLLLTAGLLGGDGFGRALAAAAGLLALLGLAWYRRRGPWRASCHPCPDRAERPVCPGFRHAWRRERAFRRLTGAWLKPGPGDAVSP